MFESIYLASNKDSTCGASVSIKRQFRNFRKRQIRNRTAKYPALSRWTCRALCTTSRLTFTRPWCKISLRKTLSFRRYQFTRRWACLRLVSSFITISLSYTIYMCFASRTIMHCTVYQVENTPSALWGSKLCFRSHSNDLKLVKYTNPYEDVPQGCCGLPLGYISIRIGVFNSSSPIRMGMKENQIVSFTWFASYTLWWKSAT